MLTIIFYHASFSFFSFIMIPELVIAIGMPSKEARAEIEIHPVIAEAKI